MGQAAACGGNRSACVGLSQCNLVAEYSLFEAALHAFVGLYPRLELLRTAFR